MLNQIKFSVGIPAYKGRYLAECIESVLNQSYPLFELIIVNDCSPDPIEEIVKQFDNSKIKYSKTIKNSGAEHVTDNYNNCFNKAEGDFFILMGDDDKMELDYLAEFASLISKYPDLDVFHCRSRIIDENSKPIIYTPSWPEHESIYDNIWHRMNGYRTQFIADFVYRVSALKINGGFYDMPLAWYTDDITAYIAMMDKGIAHTNKPVLNYRKNPINISSIGSHELKMKALVLQHIWFSRFLETKPKSDQDFVIYRSLYQNMTSLIRRHKFEIMASSFQSNFTSNYMKWVNNRKKYHVTTLEITYSAFQFFKIRRGSKKLES